MFEDNLSPPDLCR